jgi:hypothetical protein
LGDGGGGRRKIVIVGCRVVVVTKQSDTYAVNFSTGTGEYGFLPPGAYASSNAASAGKLYSFRVIE